MTDYEPRPSTDQESAPLLRDSEAEDEEHREHQGTQRPRPFTTRITDAVQEPLTGLTKVLLVEVLILLLISSVFIGLFAGAQHKLNLRDGGGGGGGGREPLPGPPQTVTVTFVSRTTDIIISPTTTTAVSTAISTTFDTITSTEISTKTKTATETDTLTSISTYTTTQMKTETKTHTETETETTTSTKTRTVIIGPEPTGPPSPPDSPSPPPEEACFTPECVVLAASILSSLDTEQNPCDNFYDYANGGWLKSHPIPADKSNVGNFEIVAQENRQIIQNILESNMEVDPLSGSYDDQLLDKLRTLYKSCMDEPKLNYIGQEPLQRVVNTVKRFFKGKKSATVATAPIAGPNQGLTNALAFLHSRGVNTLFEFYIDGDIGVDPNYMTLWFNQPSLGLPAKEYYKDRSVIEVYQDVVERLLISLNGEGDATEILYPLHEDGIVTSSSQAVMQVEKLEDTDHVWPPWPWPPWDGDDDGDDGDHDRPLPEDPLRRAHELAKMVVEFEAEIAAASLDLDLLQQDPFGTYNPVNINHLKSALPQIYFPDYFATFTPRAFPERVIITYLPYPASLSRILSKTSSEVVEAYLIVRAALEYGPHLGMSTEVWQATRTLQETLGGIKKGAVGERSEFCTQKVESALGFASGRYFVNETFGGDSKEKASGVITNIIEAFESSLKHLQWMDKQSARAAAEKAEALRVKVGYPLSPNTLDAKAIVAYYSLVKVHVDTFFDNMMSAASSDGYKMWQKLGKRRNLDEWEMFASTVNAYYNPPGNEIVFPAGILRPPYFSQGWPGYLSYGSFGMVAAHELTHAFDSSGRLYNQHGKLEEWWTPATSEEFQSRQDCIIKQYSSYAIYDGKGGLVHVNGNLTSGENIGDTGLIQSYRAWKAQYQDSYDAGKEYLLPGMDYTREQLFFISFARTWAQNIREAAAVQRVLTDPHSPNRYRVDGTLFNIPEFAEAFKCPKGAKLNPPPEKQCIFWS